MNANSTYQSPQNMTLDEWYNSNSKTLESKRQKQLEDAYVNQQLMNKYLGTQLANNGLSDTGVAPLYYKNNNANYRNEVANINASYMDNQQNLANKYYGYRKDEQDKADALAREEAAKQEAKLEEEKRTADAKLEAEKKADQEKLEKEQSDMFKMYVEKIGASLDEYGYLSDDVKNELNAYFNRDSIGGHYSNLLDEYMNLYTPNEEQKAYIVEQEEAKKYIPYYEEEANKFVDGIYGLLDENGKITQEEATELYKKLEENRKAVGEDNYMEIYRGIKEMTETTEETNKRVEKETAVKNANKRAEIEKLGAIESYNGISADTANSNSFGSYKDGKDQTNWVNEVINRAKNGKLKNGDLIDFNYGANASSTGSVYLYYDGKFYKTNKRASEANVQSNGFAEDGFWEWLLPWM